MTELKYEYIPPEGDITRHIWTLVGPNGATHIWAEPTSNRWNENYYGGVEIHSPKPLYESDWAQEASHSDCWLLKGKCWHDGSSLQFSEQIEPFIRHEKLPFSQAVHEYINSILHDRYNSYFRCEEA